MIFFVNPRTSGGKNEIDTDKDATEAKLIKAQYELMRHQCRQKNSDIVQYYSKVIDAKQNCYPINLAIEITESSATINH